MREEALRILGRWWGLLLAGLLLLAGIHLYDSWWEQQNAEAQQLHDQRIEDARSFRLAMEQLEELRSRTQEAVDRARQQELRADSLAAIQAEERAAAAAEAVETGQSTREALEAAQRVASAPTTVFLDSVEVRFERHLEADRSERRSTNRQLELLRESKVAVERQREQLRIELRATRGTLSTCRDAVGSCSAEADHLRSMTRTSFLGHIFSKRTLLDVAIFTGGYLVGSL